MRVIIKPCDIGMTLTPTKYNRGDRFIGTAILSDVTIKDEVFTGNLVGEYVEELPFDKTEIPKGVRDKMKPVTETVKSARVVYASAGEFFYLP